MKTVIDDKTVEMIKLKTGFCKDDDVRRWIADKIKMIAERKEWDRQHFILAGDMIYQHLKSGSSAGSIYMKSEDIERLIPEMPAKAQALLSWKNSVGTCLGHFAKVHPEKVKSIRTAYARKWRFTF